MKINKEIVLKEIEIYNNSKSEQILANLFTKEIPFNNDTDLVLIKVTVLNTIYSTAIQNVRRVANHIVSEDIDAKLSNGDIDVVDIIREVQFSNRKKDLYSFATKYCSFHKSNIYPIYDSYVDKVLRHLAIEDNWSVNNIEPKKWNLRDYSFFVKIIDKFKEHYRLADLSLKQIDLFLWKIGRMQFSKDIK